MRTNHFGHSYCVMLDHYVIKVKGTMCLFQSHGIKKVYYNSRKSFSFRLTLKV